MAEREFSPQTLVDTLKRKGDLHDPRVEAAFLHVPRQAFLPDLPPEEVYVDEAVVTKRDPDGTATSSSSQPSMMVIMLEQLDLRPGDNVLEIGTGTGYNAALMQYIIRPTGKVTTIEYDPVIAYEARNNLQHALMGDVTVVHGDGAQGFAPRANYDRIIATAGVWDVPRMWTRQLKAQGILVAPIWLSGMQYSAAFHIQADGTLYSANNRPCGFVRLQGAFAGPEVQVRVGSGNALTLHSNDAAHIDPAALRMLLSADAESGHLGTILTPIDFSQSLLPYLLLHLPDELMFASYVVQGEQQPYGIEGQGFAVLMQGSACFVPIRGQGHAQCFGSADTLLMVQDIIAAWDAAGRPTVEQMRMRLIPGAPFEAATDSRVLFPRRDHTLQVWLEGVP
jgi:protein-L-isoaspartate(D-aspartate) O-methyltransferase